MKKPFILLLLAIALISCKKDDETCKDLPTVYEQLSCFDCDVQGFTANGEIVARFTDLTPVDTINNPWGIPDTNSEGSPSDFMVELRKEFRKLSDPGVSVNASVQTYQFSNECSGNYAYASRFSNVGPRYAPGERTNWAENNAWGLLFFDEDGEVVNIATGW